MTRNFNRGLGHARPPGHVGTDGKMSDQNKTGTDATADNTVEIDFTQATAEAAIMPIANDFRLNRSVFKPSVSAA